MGDIAMLGIGIDARHAQQGGAQAEDAFNKVNAAAKRTSQGVDAFGNHLNKAKNECGKLGNSLKDLGFSISNLAIMGGIGTFTYALKNSASAFDELLNKSKKFGMDPGILRLMEATASLQNFKDFGTVFTYLSKNIAEASGGAIEIQKAFYDLNVSYKELSGLKPEDQFFEIAHAFSNISDQTLKTKLAMEILERGGNDVFRLLEGGASGFKEKMEETKGLIGNLSREQIELAANANEEWEKLKLTFGGFVDFILIDFGPPIIATLRGIKEAAQDIKWLYKFMTSTVGEQLEWYNKVDAITGADRPSISGPARFGGTGKKPGLIDPYLIEEAKKFKKDITTIEEEFAKTQEKLEKMFSLKLITGDEFFKGLEKAREPLLRKSREAGAEFEKMKKGLEMEFMLLGKTNDEREREIELLRAEELLKGKYGKDAEKIEVELKAFSDRYAEIIKHKKALDEDRIAMEKADAEAQRWQEELKNANIHLDDMRRNLEDEYRWLGMTNDEKEKQIGLSKAYNLLRVKYGIFDKGQVSAGLGMFSAQYDQIIQYKKAMDDAAKSLAIQEEQIQKETSLRMQGVTAIRGMWEELDQEQKILGMNNEEREVYIRTLEFAGAAAYAFGEDVGRAAEEVDKFEAAFRDFAEQRKAIEMWQTIADGMGSAFGSAFEKMITGAGSAKETLAALGKEISTLFLRQMFIQPFSQMISQGFMGGMQGMGIPGLGGGGGGLFGMGGGGGGEFPAPLLNVGGFGFGRQGAPRAAGLAAGGGGEGSPRILNVKQEIRIMTPNAESFRRSKPQIARDMAALGKSGLRGLRG